MNRPGESEDSNQPSATQRAQQAPQLIRDHQVIDAGIGIFAAREGLDLETARSALSGASVRAGVTEMQVGQTLITIHSTDAPAE